MGAVDQKAADPECVVSRFVGPHGEPDDLAVSQDREWRPSLLTQVCEREIAGRGTDESPLLLCHVEIGNRTPVAMTDRDDPNAHLGDSR